MHRRSFLRGLFGGLAALAMGRPVKVIGDPVIRAASVGGIAGVDVISAGAGYTTPPVLGELAAVTRRAFQPKLCVQIYSENPILKQLLDTSPHDRV